MMEQVPTMYFLKRPAVSTSTSQTHSTLVTSTQKWGNFELDIDVKTVQSAKTKQFS